MSALRQDSTNTFGPRESGMTRISLTYCQTAVHLTHQLMKLYLSLTGVFHSEFVFACLVAVTRMKIHPISCTLWSLSSLLLPSRASKLKTRKFLKIKRETPFGLIHCMTAIQCFVVNYFFAILFFVVLDQHLC